MKIKTLALLFLPAFCLASCGGDDGASSSKSPTYHVETSVTSIGNNQVYFGSAFNDEQFEIEDQNSVKVSAVTASMVTGFDSKQISFGKDLTATVAYQGLSLPLTYQIHSGYFVDNAYSVTLREDSTVRLDYVYGFSELTSYTIPETLSQLPDPLNTWPVTDFAQSTAGSKLTTLTLSKNVITLSSTPKDVLEIVPTDGGKITYKDNLLIADGGSETQTLFGIKSSFDAATLTVPEGVNAIALCAFSHALPSVTSLVLPSSLASLGSSFSSMYKNFINLANLASISFAGTNSKFKVDASGVLYYISRTNSIAILAPFAHAIGSVASPYAITTTYDAIALNFLYGHSNIPAVSLPTTTKRIACSATLSGLEVLVLPQTAELITIDAASIAYFPASLTVKVPEGKLSLYQAADNWKSIASHIIANA